MRIRWFRALLAGALVAAQAASAAAQSAPRNRDLTTATIEDLMNITITSASRKEQRVDDVAGAVYVITHEDIRRSGMTTLPDLLRLVPGVQVAQVNANKWAVSVRGFNGLFANKLLVLVDGRSVYNHLFAGVLWDGEDLLLEDIERIEVIRGPGAAIWGANAVNGVINILTRSAADTKGALVRASGGTFEPGQVAVRYGGAFGNTAYRLYSQWSDVGNTRLADGQPAGDHWRRATVGFRSDWASGPRAFTLQGNVTRARGSALWINFDPVMTPTRPAIIGTPSQLDGGSLLGRWTRTRANGASFQIQSFVDLAHRDEPVGDYHRRVADVEAQYHTALGARHDVVAGGGYRLMHEELAGANGYSLTPQHSDDDRISMFAHDEIAVVTDRVHLTLGARVERDALAGWGLQPTARVMWEIVQDRQHLWAATSRALRTPSLQERGIGIQYPPATNAGPLPISISVSGSPNTRSEVLSDIETGYRIALASAATVSVTGFFGRYQHLNTNEPGPPEVRFGPGGPFVFVPVHVANLLNAHTSGLEIDGHWTPLPWWRIDASYTAFRFTPRLDPASFDTEAAQNDGDASGRQWHLHSGVSLRGRAEVDVALFHVGALKRLAVPAYTRADVRLEVPLTRRLSASFVGQNIFDALHAEFGGRTATLAPTLVRRSARIQLAWRY